MELMCAIIASVAAVVSTTPEDQFISATVMPSTKLPNVSTDKYLTLALVTPLTGKLGFERNAAAVTMALKQAQIDGYLPDHTVT